MKTAIITFPKTTVGAYDVVVFPEYFGGGQVFAMVYNTETRKAVWETLHFETVGEAQEAASEWIKEQGCDGVHHE